MTDDKKQPEQEFPEIGEDLTREEIKAVLANEGYPAGGRKEWLKEVLTHLSKEEGKARTGDRAELAAEIKDVLDDNVPGAPKADDTL